MIHIPHTGGVEQRDQAALHTLGSAVTGSPQKCRATG